MTILHASDAPQPSDVQSSQAFLNVWGGERPSAPRAEGWLRAPHRKLDAARTLPYGPFHSHDELHPLMSGATYELD